MKIIQNLSSEFLLSHGVTFNGINYVINRTEVKLISTDDPSKFMVNIPDLPLGMQQPQPIENYSQLIKLIVELLPMYLRKGRDLKNEDDLQKLTQDFVRNFEFDENIKLGFAIGPQGIQIVPRNAYTYTLLTGIENHFKIQYNVGDGELTVDEIDMNPDCISLDFIKSYLAVNMNIDIDGIQVTSVSILVKEPDQYELFFGRGINFQ